jgi:hypothetical protein
MNIKTPFLADVEAGFSLIWVVYNHPTFKVTSEIVEKLVLEGSLFLGAFLRSVFG